MKTQTIELKLALAFIWNIRLKLRAESNKLRAEGDKLRAEGNELRAEGDKLCAEGDKLWAEGNKLWAKGIISFIGNIEINWTNNGCKIQNMEFLN